MKFLNVVPKSDIVCTVQQDKAWRYKKKKRWNWPKIECAASESEGIFPCKWAAV